MSHGYYGDKPTYVATHCHVCSQKFVHDHDVAIDHSGAAMVHEDGQQTNGHGSIVMHPECATILAMRLLHDVMDIRNGPDMRVVDTLRNVRSAYQMKGN
jgi:hypothetical protein